MKDSTPAPNRLAPRTTALVALAIYAPLFALLLWWALASRTAPGSLPIRDLLRPLWAICAAVFAAAGPAVILALLIANRQRLKAVMRPSRGRWIGAIVLALLTPVINFVGVPFSAWLYLFVVGWGVPLIAALLVVWYPVAALIVSGIKNHDLRVFVFLLCWCSAYAWMLLLLGVGDEGSPLILHLPGVEILLLEH